MEECYGMLVHVSAGYLPVRGWLHTCDSPVRRSPPVYCYTVLPLDLHVLSLSLAFILSQDQTLHCKVLFRNLFWPGHVFHESRLRVDSDSRSLRFVHFNILKNSCLSSRFPVPSCPRPESGCKGKACFSFSKFFKLFFQTFFFENLFKLF